MTITLVTGATGFIGRHVCRAFVDAGDEVRALVRSSSNRSVLPKAVTCVVGDMTDPESIASAIDGVDRVIHLAGMLKVPWRSAFETANVEGAAHVARACASAKNPPLLVLVSSLAAAGPSRNGRALTERSEPDPVSRYGRIKLETERAARCHADRVRLRIVRPPMVFGPGDRATLSLFRQAARGWSVLHTDPDERLSVVHVGDLAAALVAVAERGSDVSETDRGRGVYFAAHPSRPTWGEWVGLLADLPQGAEPRVARLPRLVVWLAAAVCEGYGRARDRPVPFNLDKATEALGGPWMCDGQKLAGLGVAMPALEVRVKQTIDWYRSEGWLPG